MPERAQLRGYPLLRLGVEGNGKLKQKCSVSAAANSDARPPSQRS
jgi:hypothetical protein